MKGTWRYTVAGRSGAALLNALMRTTRVERINAAPFHAARARGPVVFVLWHGRLLPPTWLHRDEGIVTLASQSADGEYITRALHHWGYDIVRGSSSRGGESALRDLIRSIRRGRSVAVTVDGPRGPRHKVKFGVLQMAQLTGAPLIPLGTAASPAWRFNSWDRFLLPKPLARIRVAYGDPVVIPRDTKQADLPGLAAAVGQRINEQTRTAEAALGLAADELESDDRDPGLDPDERNLDGPETDEREAPSP
jgi:lysophospholipid acyltransferase (LPLAT)-like uncharacterized protein